MRRFGTEREFAEAIASEISPEHMKETVEYFSKLYRYTGSPQAEAAAAYLTGRLSEYTVGYHKYEYEAYVGLPLEGRLRVSSPEPMEIPAIADVFSAQTAEMEGELYYDENGLEENITEGGQHDQYRDKIVLSRRGREFAFRAYGAGAKAVIHISITPGDIIHHRGIGAIWGNPDLDNLHSYPRLASMGIGQRDGEKLIQMTKTGRVVVHCSVRMDTGVKKSTMPVAYIPGKRETFILLSGHYDSWYEGVTDNAASDAILLELARVFSRYRDNLERGIKIAWWSGHSDASYAGSAWYCDNEWEDLRKNCVAHINLDLTGSKDAKQIIARTTLMEGMDFTADVIEGLTGVRPESYAPMPRGADQSFWGVNIPIVIMPKYEPLPIERLSPCPGGGPWWHTDRDTLDKLDLNYLLRDAKLNGILAARIAYNTVLPICITGFIGEMKKFLNRLMEQLSEEFDLEPVFEKMVPLMELAKKLECAIVGKGAGADKILKDTAGELVRLTYSYSDCYSHDEAVGEKPFPGIRKAAGIRRGQVSEEKFLAAGTTFIRQRNRLTGQIEKINQLIAAQLQGWEEEI